MCGRSSLYEEPSELLESYGLPRRLPGFVPRYNTAPSEIQWTILEETPDKLEARGLKWGLVPSWATDPSVGPKLINARAETIAEKPSFRDSVRSRRCVIMVDGYYEWARTGRTKTPYRIQMSDRKAFVLAGLWDRWQDENGGSLDTCAVITTAANSATSPIHHRMPVILSHSDSLKWIKGKASGIELLSLLTPYARTDLDVFQVSRAVNDTANDSPVCITPADPSTQTPESDEQVSLLL